MSLLVEMMHKGGPFMWLLLLVLVTAPTLTIVGAVLLGMRRWTPSMLFFAGPLGLVLFGAVGRIQGHIMVSQAVMHASTETKSVLLHAGLGVAAYTEVSGWALAALLLLLSAVAVAVALLAGAGPGARYRPVPAGLAGLAGVVSALLVGAVAFVGPGLTGSPGPELLFLPVFSLLGGLAMGVAALRDNSHEDHASRLANGRAVVASMVLAGLVCVVATGALHGFTVVHEAMAHASPELRGALMYAGIVGSRAWLLPGAGGLLVLGAAAAVISLGGIRHLFAPRHLVSGGVVVLCALVAAAAPIYANYQAWRIGEGTVERHLAKQLEQVSELPRAVAVGSDEIQVQPLVGFNRSVAWQGSDWRPGTTFEGVRGSWSLPQDSSDADPLLVVAPADLAASNLTGTIWARGDEGPVRASLLVALDHGMEELPLSSPWLVSSRVGLLQLDWMPADAWAGIGESAADPYGGLGSDELEWDKLLFVEGRSDGLAVHGLLRSLERVDDLEEAITALHGHTGGKPEDTIVVVPAAGWSLQDLVSHCLAASSMLPEDEDGYWMAPPSRCVVTAALPPSLAEQRAAEIQARGGGLASQGTLRDLGNGYAPGIAGPGATAEGGDLIVMGSLDKTVIQKVIQRHLNQIRYCYQRELTKDPDLAGRVVIKFVVARDGTVSSATVKSSTMGNNAVETCIAGRFMRFMFPEPAGGGIVIVSYPFVFSPA